MCGETGGVGLGGNWGIEVYLVRYRMDLHCPRCDVGFLWMAIVGIGEAGVSLGEVEELGKNTDSLDGDWEYGCHRHDEEAASVGNRKVLRLLADIHGCSWEMSTLEWVVFNVKKLSPVIPFKYHTYLGENYKLTTKCSILSCSLSVSVYKSISFSTLYTAVKYFY